MPETIGNENPVSQTARKRNERTKAKFSEDANKIIAEAKTNASVEALDKLWKKRPLRNFVR
jgi:hypothetical protein